MIMIKGGWLGRIPAWKRWHEERKEALESSSTPSVKWVVLKAFDWLLDGTQLSAFIMLFAIEALMPGYGAAFALAWWLWVLSSMGEEAGAVGDHKEAWGPYIDHGFGRGFGIKKAMIHGFFGGALLALATGWVWFIPALATFPIVYFIGNSLNRVIFEERGWAISEILYDIVILVSILTWVWGVDA